MTPALDKLRSLATSYVGGVSSWRLAPAIPVAAGSPIAPIKIPSSEILGTNIIEQSLWELGGAIYAAGRPSTVLAG